MARDIFLKITDVKGESMDDKHKEEIEIESFSWGITQQGGSGYGGGAGAGKANFNDFHFTKRVDKASPELFLACANGKHFKEALLSVRKAGENPLEYLKVKFSDVLVSSFQPGGNDGSDVVMESISFNFTKVEMEYQEQGPDGKAKGGPVKQGYDVKINKKV